MSKIKEGQVWVEEKSPNLHLCVEFYPAILTILYVGKRSAFCVDEEGAEASYSHRFLSRSFSLQEVTP